MEKGLGTSAKGISDLKDNVVRSAAFAAADKNSSETELYRHFDAGGNLLYVGVSLSTVARLAQHRDTAHWFDDITRIDVERFPTREAAEEAETQAIQKEAPKHNIAQGNDTLSLSAARARRAAAEAARVEAQKAKAAAEAERREELRQYIESRIEDFAASLGGPFGAADMALVRQAVLLTLEIENIQASIIQTQEAPDRKELLQLSSAVTKIVTELRRPKQKVPQNV